MENLILAGLGILAAKLSPLIPGLGPIQLGALLGPLGPWPTIPAYVCAGLVDRGDAVENYGDPCAMAAPGRAPGAAIRRARALGLCLGLGLWGIGLSSYPPGEALALALAAALCRKPARASVVFTTGRLALAAASALGAPNAVLALGISSWLLLPPSRSQELGTWEGRDILLGVVSAATPGLPTTLAASLASSPAGGALIGGVVDGVGLGLTTQGPLRTGLAIEAARAGTSVPVLPLACLGAVGSLGWAAKPVSHPWLPRAVALTTALVAGGAAAPILVGAGLAAAAVSQDDPSLRAWLIAAPSWLTF